jgi:hypothetical protein
MDDDFDNEIGLPDDEIGGSADDLADVGMGGLEGELEPGIGEAGGTRSSGGARARQSTPTPRAPKAAAPAKKPAAPKAAKKKPAKKAAKKAKAAKKPKAKAKKKAAPKAARKSGKKAAKRKK